MSGVDGKTGTGYDVIDKERDKGNPGVQDVGTWVHMSGGSCD